MELLKRGWSAIDGKKTYFITAIGVLFVLSQVWAGSLTWQQAVEAILPLLGLGAVRHGIKKS